MTSQTPVRVSLSPTWCGAVAAMLAVFFLMVNKPGF